MENVKVKQFAAGSCYSYLVSSKKEAFLIDPHISLQNSYKNYLKKKKLILKFVVDTHTHADHFSLAAVLKKKYDLEVLMHENAISDVADKRLSENDSVELGPISFKVIYTPGHTDDAISLYGQGYLFTGDVLLIGSVGRTDFQNGSPESMFDTLGKLKTLKEETIVYPGHDYHGVRFSTISKEKKTNPFLKESERERFIANMRAKIMPKPFNIDNIIRLNQRGEAAALTMVSPKDAFREVGQNSKVKLLDVRSPSEFSQEHIKDSINIPVNTLGAKIDDLGKDDKSYIVFCRTGNRSPMAADMLLQAGIHGVKVMDGGMTGWKKERLPLIKGQGGLSLERQIRIIAGSLVLSGILLAWFIHWGFIFIALFVSCGLIFAGLTDNCLMGMLLMKLPYNKRLYKVKLGGGTCAIG